MKTSEQFKAGKNGIIYVGNYFKEWFYGTSFKKSKKKLFTRNLERYMTDQEILEGFKPQECTLGDVLNTFQHSNTVKNGQANILYVKDKDGVLRAVRVRWDDDGWRVRASSIERQRSWGGGYQVFSRNFFGTQTLGPSEPLSLEQSIEICKKNGYKVIKEY